MQVPPPPMPGERVLLTISWLRGQDSNLRPLGYEPNELPLLHPAAYVVVGFRQSVAGLRFVAPSPSPTAVVRRLVHLILNPVLPLRALVMRLRLADE